MASDDLDFGETIRGFVPGQKAFGRYRLEKILGRGGMGVVWLAHDEDLERDVALKFLPEVVAGDKQAIQDLKRETRRSLELTHPHIIRIYDFVQDASSAAISMEYVTGDTLASLKVDQPDGHFEAADIKKWVEQLCTALTYAHAKAKVVHRDLKPANLMIDAEGDLKIADFGIAANISDSVSRVSVQAGSSGTPVYMSPQQMMGEKPAVTDDVYALGATLYDLLTSRPPFYSGNVMMQVMNKAPMSMAERRVDLEVKGAEIPPAWESAVQSCLAKEAADRPSSVAEIWQIISGTAPVSPAPKPAAPPVPPARTPEPPKPAPVPPTPPATEVPEAPQKSRAGMWLGLAAAVFVIGGGVGWWFGIEQPRRLEAAAVKAAWEASVAEEARLAAIRVPFEIDSEPSGATVAIDGEQLGTTPFQHPEGLTLGFSEVTLTREGYEPWTKIYEIIEGISDAPLAAQADLVRATGSVNWVIFSNSNDISYWLSDEGPPSLTNPSADYEGVIEKPYLDLPTGRYDGILRDPSVLAPGGGLVVPVSFEIKKGEITEVAADLGGERLQLTTDVTDEVTYELWGRGDQYLDESEAWVGEGTLPIDLPVAPGEYQLVLKRPSRDLERRFPLDVEGDMAAEFNMSGPTLIITPQTGGAEVVDAEGSVLGAGSRVVLNDLPSQVGLTYTVRREGYEPTSKSFFFPESHDAETEVTWDPALEEASTYAISTDYRRGPSQVRVDFDTEMSSTTRMVVNGEETVTGPTPSEISMSQTYNIERFNSVGAIRTATSGREIITNGVEVYRPNTVVRFEWKGGEWIPEFVSGGYIQDMDPDTVESPFYPAMWVNRATLPDSAQSSGDTWEVPILLASTLIPSFKTDRPTGKISGRIARLGQNGDYPTAEIVYTYEIEGPLNSPVKGMEMDLNGRTFGTINLVMDLQRRFISSGSMNSTTSVGVINEYVSSRTEISSVLDFTVTPLAWPEGGPPSSGSNGQVGDEADQVFTMVDAMPQPIVRIAPVYPQRMISRGIEGRVIVGFVVTKEGGTRDVEVIQTSGHDSLDQAAVDAIKKYKFKPGQQRGQLVNVRMTLPVRFQLED